MRWKVLLTNKQILIGERKLLRDNLEGIGFWLTSVEGKDAPLFITWNAVLYIEEIP